MIVNNKSDNLITAIKELTEFIKIKENEIIELENTINMQHTELINCRASANNESSLVKMYDIERNGKNNALKIIDMAEEQLEDLKESIKTLEKEKEEFIKEKNRLEEIIRNLQIQREELIKKSNDNKIITELEPKAISIARMPETEEFLKLKEQIEILEEEVKETESMNNNLAKENKDVRKKLQEVERALYDEKRFREKEIDGWQEANIKLSDELSDLIDKEKLFKNLDVEHYEEEIENLKIQITQLKAEKEIKAEIKKDIPEIPTDGNILGMFEGQTFLIGINNKAYYENKKTGGDMWFTYKKGYIYKIIDDKEKLELISFEDYAKIINGTFQVEV